MTQTYVRVPRVHRLEYLEALLRSYEGSNAFDEAQAKQSIQREIQDFEQTKARALRRQRPRVREGATTLNECIQLALHLRLIDRYRRLTTRAAEVLDPAQRRSILLQSMWQVYPRFSQVILRIRDTGRLELPFYDWDQNRQQSGDALGLDIDRKNFEIIRDFATQLGLVNWYPIENSRQIVYPVACTVTQAEITCMVGVFADKEISLHHCPYALALEVGLLTVQDGHYQSLEASSSLPEGCLTLQTDTDRVIIKDHKVSSVDFEQALWQAYLELADMIPMSPVLYPSLRNQVCAALRISDQAFDRHLIALIRQPQRLKIHPSDGTLNYAANLAHIGKFLPPQTSEGNFIVYLKLERRQAS